MGYIKGSPMRGNTHIDVAVRSHEVHVHLKLDVSGLFPRIHRTVRQSVERGIYTSAQFANELLA